MTPVPLLTRLVLTWLAIFPLVVIARLLLDPLVQGWPDVAQTALTMGVVVPIAVCGTVPLLMRAHRRVRGLLSVRES